jgi:tRNA pseudouridine55 synthase
VLVVAKPAGPTSHDVVGLVRRLSATRRVGHGGTLDPFASGVLPVFLGHATRLSEYHLGDRKRYTATVCFGASSATDDLEGDRVPAEGPAPARATVEAALPAFLGEQSQVPPDYSAVQVAGRRAYALARAGLTPELAPRTITIHDLRLLEWDGSDPERPIAILDVACSAGTYIRSLARDLGAAVGNAAYLGALSRTQAGTFTLDDALPLDALREAGAAGVDAVARLLRPVDAGLEAIPQVHVGASEVVALARGQRVTLPRADHALPEGAPLRVHDPDGRIVAIGHRVGRDLWPDKVLFDTAPVRGTRPDEGAAEEDPAPAGIGSPT